MYYPIDLTPDDNGTFLVTCPLLPEVTTFGDTREDAIRHGADAVEEAIAARVAAWHDVPLPSGVGSVMADYVRLPLQATMKLLLSTTCKRDGVTRAELARRMGVHREQVDRLFRFDHASRIDQVEAAFRAIGHDIGVSLEMA